MDIEEAKLYLEHTSKDDFNLEEWQKENRYQAIQVVLKEIERLNYIINNLINYIGQEWYCFDNESVEFYVAKDILNKLQELKGEDKE